MKEGQMLKSLQHKKRQSATFKGH